MFEGMKVVSKGEIAVGLFTAAVLGGALATIADEQLARYQARQKAEAARNGPQQAPVVEKRTGAESVFVFQTDIDGRSAICRLYMNHRTRTWSLTC